MIIIVIHGAVILRLRGMERKNQIKRRGNNARARGYFLTARVCIIIFSFLFCYCRRRRGGYTLFGQVLFFKTIFSPLVYVYNYSARHARDDLVSATAAAAAAERTMEHEGILRILRKSVRKRTYIKYIYILHYV